MNISKEKREKLIEYLEKLKENKEDEDIRIIQEIEKALNEKKYGLVWEEHSEKVDEELKTKIPVFREIEERKIEKDKDKPYNFLLEGDNLHSLKLLQKTHKGKIDVIYIDPPYNTGNKDFIYNDNYVGTEDGYRHSKWLSFMEKRLRIAKELLTDEGVIFISIDDNEQAQLKLLCDEVFGGSNFIAEIVRNTNSSKNQSLYVSVTHEYCLIYSKNIDKLSEKHKNNKWGVEKNNIYEYLNKVKKLQEDGLNNDEITKELKELTKYPRFIDFTNYWYFDERGLYRKGDLGGVKQGNMEPIINPITKQADPIPPGGFRYSTDKLCELIDENRIHFHEDGSLPTIKRYLNENIKQRPKSIMSDDQRPDYSLLKNMNIEFDNPKQLSFIKRIFSIFDNNSIFLDFFAGSGTTGHAVIQLNKEDGGTRRYILCTNNENGISENVCYERIKKVICGYDYIQKNKKNIVEPINNNLKYFKTDFISKFSEDEIISQMMLHIKEMIELENGIEIDGKKCDIIYTEEELDEKIGNISNSGRIFMVSGIFMDEKQQKILADKNIQVIEIPEYYFKEELKEMGEI